MPEVGTEITSPANIKDEDDKVVVKKNVGSGSSEQNAADKFHDINLCRNIRMKETFKLDLVIHEHE